MPDVLNTKAETSQDVFDMESADGDEKIARVQLSEAVGAEPSPNINIDAMANAPLPESLTVSMEELIDRAVKDRPRPGGAGSRDSRCRRPHSRRQR